MMSTVKEELIQTLRTWGSKEWHKNRFMLENGREWHPSVWMPQYSTLAMPLDDKYNKFKTEVFGELSDTEYLRKFMQEAVVLPDRNAYREQLQKARADAGMGVGKPWAIITYDVTAAATGVDVVIERFYGNRTLLSAEFYDWRTRSFADLYMASFCDHDWKDNGSRMCYSRRICTKCGHRVDIDSSD